MAAVNFPLQDLASHPRNSNHSRGVSSSSKVLLRCGSALIIGISGIAVDGLEHLTFAQ
jgi:hypothetical protein